jgi:hypothetical protein
MIWQQTPYTFPLFATALITLAAALYAYRQRQVPGAIFMFRMMLAVMIWVVFYALELNTADLAGKKLWSKLQYIGIVYTCRQLLFICPALHRGMGQYQADTAVSPRPAPHSRHHPAAGLDQ